MPNETDATFPATLILPGIGNSGPDHWQSIWQNMYPGFTRVPQRDWAHPVCDEWVVSLENTVQHLGRHVVLVAHSLGCALLAHWAATTQCEIKAALIVAPPDPTGPSFPSQAIGFSPLPMQIFPFPSILVASSNDPYGDIHFARSAASAWGSHFINVGPLGHINAKSGLGGWQEGFALYKELAV